MTAAQPSAFSAFFPFSLLLCPFLILQFEEVLVSIRKVRFVFFQHFLWQKLMKRTKLDCLQCTYLLQALYSIPALANPMIPLKISASDILIGFIVTWVWILSYLLLLLPFCLPNVQLTFYLSCASSLLVLLGVNFHSLKANTSIPVTFFIWSVQYGYLLFFIVDPFLAFFFLFLQMKVHKCLK